MAVLIKNRKASFEYEFLDKYVAGIQLLGSEVKSIREAKASIAQAYCYFKDGELFIKNMHISEFKQSGTHQQHDPLREKKLLLTKKELKKLFGGTTIKGNSIIPVNIHLTDKGLIKLEIVLARGKKLYDKRQSIKEKDVKRDMKREQ